MKISKIHAKILPEKCRKIKVDLSLLRREVGMKILCGMVGRIALSLIFVLAAISKILNWDSTYQMLCTALSNWIGYAAQMPSLQSFLNHLLSMAPLLLI